MTVRAAMEPLCEYVGIYGSPVQRSAQRFGYEPLVALTLSVRVGVFVALLLFAFVRCSAHLKPSVRMAISQLLV